jgi:hypothetical protein
MLSSESKVARRYRLILTWAAVSLCALAIIVAIVGRGSQPTPNDSTAAYTATAASPTDARQHPNRRRPSTKKPLTTSAGSSWPGGNWPRANARSPKAVYSLPRQR